MLNIAGIVLCFVFSPQSVSCVLFEQYLKPKFYMVMCFTKMGKGAKLSTPWGPAWSLKGAHRVRGLSITQLDFPIWGSKTYPMELAKKKEKKKGKPHTLLRSLSVLVHFSLSIYYFSLYIPTQSFRQYRNLNVVVIMNYRLKKRFPFPLHD